MLKSYKPPKVLDSQIIENNSSPKEGTDGRFSPQGVPVAAFIVAGAVTAATVAFVVNVGVGWNAAVGTSTVVSD